MRVKIVFTTTKFQSTTTVNAALRQLTLPFVGFLSPTVFLYAEEQTRIHFKGVSELVME